MNRYVPVNDRVTMYTKMAECRTYAMVIRSFVFEKFFFFVVITIGI